MPRAACRVPGSRGTQHAARGALSIVAILALSACTGRGIQDVLAPDGPQAARIADFFWVAFALAVGVFVAFAAILAWALVRAHRRQRRGVENELAPAVGRRLVLWGGVGVPLAILFALLVFSTVTDRRISRLDGADGGDVLTLEVVGHQFWWEVKYLDPAAPHREFTTANEIHIPAGRPVRLALRSRDVIHSFWIPNLHGKTDLIPGRQNAQVIQADRPGVYRGQCAEFCGVQHAKMAMLVIAHDSAGFETWRERQLRPHAPPTDPVLAKGQSVFERNGCGVCHAIRGTDAKGTVAPNLSHFGTRRTIAAGALPNTRGHLGGWISDPQDIKPGSRMPAVALEGSELQALLSYLHSLR